MTHRLSSPGAVAILAAAAVLMFTLAGSAAQQAPASSSGRQGSLEQGQAGSAPVVVSDDANAGQTRDRLVQLFEKYPPALGRVLKLDPSLLSDQRYLAPYPALASFLSQHPEVAHNPGYFLERV